MFVKDNDKKLHNAIIILLNEKIIIIIYLILLSDLPDAASIDGRHKPFTII